MVIQYKKIVHAPLEIAGQVGLICSFLKQQGVQATGYNFFPTYLDYRKVLNTDSYELIKIFDKAVDFFDLFHFHNSYTFLEDHRDIPLIAEAGKRMIMHHRGNDVRARGRARKWGNYSNAYVNAECSLPDETIDKQLKFFAKHMDAAIVQDYELYPYVEDYYAAEGKKVYVLPRLINLEGIEPVYPTSVDQTPLIVHAPTQREFKGTAAIIETIEKLRLEIPLRFELVEGLSHAKAMQLYRQADIVIDQVLCGAYGNLSVEAMALGKPVVCYIREDLIGQYPPDLPIVSANPEQLYEVLRSLLQQPEWRAEKGKQGRKYVENYHEAQQVIQELITIYDEIGKSGERRGS